MPSDVYVSIDIEADGPIPGPNSMLSLGAVAFDVDGKEISSFSANLQTMEGAVGDPDTMKWWSTQPAAWEACREHPVSPQHAMEKFVAWLDGLPGKPVAVGYPIVFDLMFVHWYSIKFAGRSPLSFSGIDIKTFAWSKLGGSYRQATKRNMPKSWFPKTKHSHVAVEDAREQGLLFFGMLKDKKRDMCSCGAPADWLRVTQFAGTHRFCDMHAKAETDFGQDNPSSFYWVPVEEK